MANQAIKTNAIEISSTVCAKEIYFKLNKSEVANEQHGAGTYLLQMLEESQSLPHEMPDDIDLLEDWIKQRAEATGEQYHHYLAERRAGALRRYFTSRAHALYFLKGVAPTKLVDGAWLYGVLSRWSDPEYLPLIRTYLEELGDGVGSKNHVLLYRKLLSVCGCDQWRNLSEAHFVQGAIQLSLGYEAEHFLPEVLGYNLGFEQLPLHLLITSYELNELGIDPYYFTLHITIDNASTGHGHKAVESVKKLMPIVGDSKDFYRRIKNGYRLNDLGANTLSIIESFKLESEVIQMLKDKSVVGKNMHSDYCRVAGRTINDWLSNPMHIPDFLKALTEAGWIVRGAPAANSRFWRLIEGEQAQMFGVFSDYEQQLLRDWIVTPDEATHALGAAHEPTQRVPSFRAQQRALGTPNAEQAPEYVQQIGAARSVIRKKYQQDDVDDFTIELRSLEEKLCATSNKKTMMEMLIKLMSPANHHTHAGLMATRVFNKFL